MTNHQNTTASPAIPAPWRPSEWREVIEYHLYSTFSDLRDLVRAEPGLLAVKLSRDGSAVAHEVVMWGVADRYTFPLPAAGQGEIGPYLEHSLEEREEGVPVCLVLGANGLRVAEEGVVPVTYEQAGVDR